jgi:hypothetical protein
MLPRPRWRRRGMAARTACTLVAVASPAAAAAQPAGAPSDQPGGPPPGSRRRPQRRCWTRPRGSRPTCPRWARAEAQPSVGRPTAPAAGLAAGAAGRDAHRASLRRWTPWGCLRPGHHGPGLLGLRIAGAVGLRRGRRVAAREPGGPVRSGRCPRPSPAFGTPICITDCYRTYAGHVRLYGQKPVLAAVPGTSNHGWGLAVDLCGGIERFGTQQYAWMQANAGS